MTKAPRSNPAGLFAVRRIGGGGFIWPLSDGRSEEGVPEERRILNKVEDSRSYLTDHAVQALLPALPLRQGRQVWPPSRQAEMVVPALRISVHQPVSRRGGR